MTRPATAKKRFLSIDGKMPILAIVTLLILAFSGWTTSVVFAMSIDHKASLAADANGKQDTTILMLTQKNTEVSERLARIEENQKNQTDLIKDLRDDIRRSLRKQ